MRAANETKLLSIAVAAIALLAGFASPSSLYRTGQHGYLLPNPHVTPGEATAIPRVELCETKWGLDRRHVTPRMKEHVCARYGAHACPGPSWEIDHLIPRELGGKDSIENLWPQPIKEARHKDVLENFLHRAVCSGAISLLDAQEQIRRDWTKAYTRMKGLERG